MSNSKVKSGLESELSRKRVETDYGSLEKRRTHEDTDFRQIDILKKEIESLKNQLRKNDSEYEIEIKVEIR